MGPGLGLKHIYSLKDPLENLMAFRRSQLQTESKQYSLNRLSQEQLSTLQRVDNFHELRAAKILAFGMDDVVPFIKCIGKLKDTRS